MVDITEIGHSSRSRDPIDVLLDSKSNKDEFIKILTIFPVLGSDGRYGYKYAYNMARGSVDVELSLSEYQNEKQKWHEQSKLLENPLEERRQGNNWQPKQQESRHQRQAE